ncbi:DUF5343 domain-containing protein [Gordonia hydrophobica]|uniref:DUF5343 domain-containing protein n=1 Tax=Gordonia hydrophobica TaxID=40516 RepID=A0ABZ2U2F9_9ACTN|nr:DUF5343 domain-containing protein [Gordonia hydrophobica]MBM7369075.1 hypothetical protein [Gordonia hydrophobica]
MAAYGNITKALDRIKEASTPPRFTQDFLETKIGLTGGGARPVIPFLKRTGFLNSDGSPTDLYRRFRSSITAGKAAAEAMRKGYAALYESHEYVHDLSDDQLKDTILQATGWEKSNSNVRAAVGSFKALRAYADFDTEDPHPDQLEYADTERASSTDGTEIPTITESPDIKLSYTINLNLPATTDVAVFNAIFKSLKEHLL